MTRKLLLIPFLLLAAITVQAQSADQQKKAKEFILKVIAKYKNPMSYYPLRRDIFLPDEEEAAKIDREQNYPAGARSLGFVVFVKNDEEYYREPFVDADGDILDLSLYRFPRTNYSLKSDSELFRKKQQYYLNKYPSASQLMYFNTHYRLEEK